jgi:O-antigen/teichoic acid export membrane protein
LQLRVRHIARNVLFNWFGTIANMAVGFFLSPFILHRLGNLTFGVWVLSVSVVGYMNLLDLGMQNSVLRFVSKGYTQNDHEGASEVFSAALWIRLQISALVLLLSVGLAAVFPFMFKVPAELAGDARKAVVLIGASAAISMLIGVFGGVLSALNRYDLQNSAILVQTVIRVVGVVAVLRTGHGIVAIAVCELVATLVGNLLVMGIARRLYPGLRIQLKIPRKETLRKIWSYSVYVFLTGIAVQLVYQTDNIVVGAFVSASAVTFYAIANSLCRYATQVIGSIGTTFVPAASTYEAAGDKAGLLMLYRNGTRAMLMVSLPMMITLIVRGSTFIGLWMGPQYSHSSGIVLIILSVALLVSFANRTAGSIAFGIEKHKPIAVLAISEGIVNLVLSIVLARRYGLYGVALGTFIPSVAVQLLFWPSYVSKLVGVSAFDVVVRIWAPMYLAALPFGIASYVIDHFYPAHSLPIFFLQVIATLPIFFIVVALTFRSYLKTEVFPRLRSLVATGAN